MPCSVLVLWVKVDLQRALTVTKVLSDINTKFIDLVHIEIAAETETIKAVPTPHLDVGEKVLDTQLL